MNAYNHRRPLVNLRVGKCSHFVLYDDQGRFGAGTDIASAKDNDPTHQFEWTGKAFWAQSTAYALKIRLKRKPMARNAPAVAATAAGTDSGDISITLTDNIPVDDITVDYVDDGET